MVLRFHLPNLNKKNGHLSSGAGKIGQLMTDVLIGLTLTATHETKKKKDVCSYKKKTA
jgi:hypothetical protein